MRASTAVSRSSSRRFASSSRGKLPATSANGCPRHSASADRRAIGRLDGARLDKRQGRCDGFLEAPLVDAAGVDVEAVAATFPHDHVAELHPEVRDVRLQRRARARGRALTPEAFEQGIRGDDTAGVCGEQREHGALLGPPSARWAPSRTTSTGPRRSISTRAPYAPSEASPSTLTLSSVAPVDVVIAQTGSVDT